MKTYLKRLAGALLGAGMTLNMGSSALAQSRVTYQAMDPSVMPVAHAAGACANGVCNTGVCDAPTYCFDERPACGTCVWGGAEYLLWWVKDAPLPFPLVTSNNPNVPGNTGLPALGQPGTIVLYGGNDQRMPEFSGVRLFAGAWLDDQQEFGLEFAAFWLPSQSAGFSAQGDAAGNPSLAAPFFNAGPFFNRPTGSEDFFDASFPGIFAGNITIRNTTELWGGEANALWNLSRNASSEVHLIAGYRYLDLNESLTYALNQNGLFAGGVTLNNADAFRTHNQFHGGQIGVRGAVRRGNLTAEVTAKLALGANQERVAISGQTTQIGGAAPGTFPGGIYALPSNIGRREQTEFAVIPEVQLKVGYDVTTWLRLTAGYNFLYWDNVVRPGNQIDRTVNRSQAFGGALVGAARPAPLFNETDFFVHGLSFGAEFRW